MYKEEDLVCVARRENNTKRSYLVVNRLQAKHIPAKPGRTLELFDQLAQLVKREYGNETLLLIGFAETATAVGARLAVYLNSYYMQTTRETETGVNYIYFSESHSHATEQKLAKDGLDEAVGRVQRIVFVEDEVTTGNTVKKIIQIIRDKYNGAFSFSVASLLNGMSGEAIGQFRSDGIGIHYILKTDHSDYTERAASYEGDGTYYEKAGAGDAVQWDFRELCGYVNARHLVSGRQYREACQRLWEQVHAELGNRSGQRILVLGTEEFMYPAIYAASRLEDEGNEVRCHATTRSPIEVSTEETYPLHARFELRSFYDSGRTTYVYDLGKYDLALVFTDACGMARDGADTLMGALCECGNTDIVLYRWCEL